MNPNWFRAATSAGVAATLVLSATAASAQDEEDVVVEEGARQPVEVDMLGEAVPDMAEAVDDIGDEDDDARLEWGVRANTEFIATDNRDMRELDESSDQDVIDTDDRQNFGIAQLDGEVNYDVTDRIEFDAMLRFESNFPTDQLARTSSSHDLQMWRMSAGVDLVDADPFGATIVVGRQPFAIGGVPDDYMLAGTIDGVTATLDARAAGRLRVLAIDWFSGNDIAQDGYYVYEPGFDNPTDMRGETNTFRTGLVYEFDRDATDIGLTAKAYWFYATVGGAGVLGSGADITYGGRNGNFRDRDFQNLYGARVNYRVDLGDDEDGDIERGLEIYGDFAMSDGIDRQEPVDPYDVETDGMAFGGGLLFDYDINDDIELEIGASFYTFDGAEYDSNGLQFEKGFVGMHGARIGGPATGRVGGWRPSASLAGDGVRYRPHSQRRVAGTQFLHANLELELYDFEIGAEFWSFTDTSSTFVEDFENLSGVETPPFGTTFESIYAQERFGEALGTEIGVHGAYTFDDALTFSLEYGVFNPGAFYDIPVERIVNTAESTDVVQFADSSFWTLIAGAELEF